MKANATSTEWLTPWRSHPSCLVEDAAAVYSHSTSHAVSKTTRSICRVSRATMNPGQRARFGDSATPSSERPGQRGGWVACRGARVGLDVVSGMLELGGGGRGAASHVSAVARAYSRRASPPQQKPERHVTIKSNWREQVCEFLKSFFQFLTRDSDAF